MSNKKRRNSSDELIHVGFDPTAGVFTERPATAPSWYQVAGRIISNFFSSLFSCLRCCKSDDAMPDRATPRHDIPAPLQLTRASSAPSTHRSVGPRMAAEPPRRHSAEIIRPTTTISVQPSSMANQSQPPVAANLLSSLVMTPIDVARQKREKQVSAGILRILPGFSHAYNGIIRL